MTKSYLSFIVLLLISTPSRAEETWFDADPNHPWNRLRECFFVRASEDGSIYRREELEPPFQALSKHLLEGTSHERAITLLDDFLRRRVDQLIREPVKRAVLQRDLWAVFGMTAGTGAMHWWQLGDQLVAAGIEDTGDASFARKRARRELQRRLVAVMRRIALSPTEIVALPDNLLQAANSGSFPASYDRLHPERPFLPADLLQSDGPWVLLSNSERADGLAAPAHVQFTNGRSLFLVFLRLPEGREATKAYLADIGKPKSEQFPEGTQLALVRRMLLIDTTGNVCVSPLTEEVQFRVFRHLDAVDSYELLLSRKDLFAGRRGGLRAVAADETSYYDISGFHGGSPTGTRDPLEIKPRPRPIAVMDCCVTCHRFHGDGGIRSVASAFASGRKYPDLQPATQDEQIRSALTWLKKTYSWGLLQGLWEQ